MREPDVDRLLASLSEEQFYCWQLYGLVEPWGGRADDWRFGVLASLLDQVYGAWVEKYDPRDPEVFFPMLKTEPDDEAPDDEDEMTEAEKLAEHALWRSWVRQGGGEVTG